MCSSRRSRTWSWTSTPSAAVSVSNSRQLAGAGAAYRSELDAGADPHARSAEPDIFRRAELDELVFGAQEEILRQRVIETQAGNVAEVPFAIDVVGQWPIGADRRGRRWNAGRRRVGAGIGRFLTAIIDVDRLRCVDLRDRYAAKTVGQKVAERPTESAAHGAVIIHLGVGCGRHVVFRKVQSVVAGNEIAVGFHVVDAGAERRLGKGHLETDDSRLELVVVTDERAVARRLGIH